MSCSWSRWHTDAVDRATGVNARGHDEVVGARRWAGLAAENTGDAVSVLGAVDGFQIRGWIAHPDGPVGLYDSSACSNWWTQARTEVKRSI
jgi:hypothetical protein